MVDTSCFTANASIEPQVGQVCKQSKLSAVRPLAIGVEEERKTTPPTAAPQRPS